MMDLALMLVALVLAGEGTSAPTAVIAAPEELGLGVNVVLVALKISEPLERRIATTSVKTEIVVVTHFPGCSRLCFSRTVTQPKD